MKASLEKFFETGPGIAVFYLGMVAVLGGLAALTITAAPPLAALLFMTAAGAGMQGCMQAGMSLMGMELRSETHAVPPYALAAANPSAGFPAATPGFNNAVSGAAPAPDQDAIRLMRPVRLKTNKGPE